MAKAKSSNLALIRGPRRYLEGSYHEVPPTFVYHYTFKQVGNTVIVANAKSKSGWTRATPEQAEQYRKIKAQHDAYCLKAFAQRAKARLALNATSIKALQSQVEQRRQWSAVLEAKLENISNLKIVSVTAR